MKLPQDHPARKHLQSAQELLKLISKDPGLLQYEELGFIRTYLQSMGVKMPQNTEDDDDVEEIYGNNQENFNKESESEASEEEDKNEDVEISDEEEDEPDPEVVEMDSEPFPEMPDPERQPADDDFEQANSYKVAAAEAFESHKFEEAIENYTKSLLLVPNGITFAKRAECLLSLKPPRPMAAIHDCSQALEHNPDSAKALKMRGTAYRMLGKWEEAANDLRKACTIDFDEHTEDTRRAVEKHMQKIEKAKLKEKIKERKKSEKEKKKRLNELEKARKKAKEEYERQQERGNAYSSGYGSGPMPGMGGMPGGMPGMEGLMSDPEIAAGLQNPKVMEALQKMMSDPTIMMDPSKSAEYLKDPEVAAFMQKFTSKMAGGMGGMPGGMGSRGTGTPFPSAPGATAPSDDVD